MEDLGYLALDLDDDDKDAAPAKALIAAWTKARVESKAWWWELTLVRDEPEGDAPRLKASVQSSTHNEDHDVAGGKPLGHWWITSVQPAADDAAKAITLHRSLY